MATRDDKVSGASVRASGLSKLYGEFAAVDDVSLHVGAGEFVSLLGPSGSGKTTLLMMIAGFERPSGGKIHVGDNDFTYVAPNRRGIGMVFQKYALFPHMSIAENIAFPLKMRKLDRATIAGKVDAALSLVHLDGYGERLPNQLSGGQQQRVAVARALVFEPPVLLMDEPLGALDKKLREQMQIEIKAIQRRLGVTVVYVTHDQEEALTMSDRVAVMNKGRLAQIGSPVALYQAPASPFVADFIGKMNFLPAHMLGTDRDVYRLRLLSGVELEAAANGETVVADSAVTLAMRPERLALEARGAGSGNVIAGHVDAAIFVGSFRTYLVRPEGFDCEPLHIQVPALSEHAAFEAGDAVDVVVDSSAMRVFPAGGV